MKKSKNVLILLVCLVIIAGLALLTVFGVGSTPLDARNIKLGLDLNGGVSITYQAVDGSNPTKDQMQGTLAVIQRRLDAQGYTEANAYLDGDTRIRVEIPGVKDASQAVEEIGKTAMLRFVGIDWSQVIAQGLDKNYYDQYGEALKKQMEDNGQDTSTLTDDTIQSDAAQYFQSYPADAITQFPQLLQDAIDQGLAEEVVTGKNVSSATYQKGQVSSSGSIEPYVKLEFDSDGTKLFASGTEKYLNKQIAILLDDTCISIPNVKSIISTGDATITGMSSEEEAKNLAADITGGALPVELTDIEHNSVGATLGQNALKSSILAGILGFITICIFMIAVYRLPGLASAIALVFYVSAELLMISVLGWTLTLPGIGGIILSIGMAVDANCIIWARLREEILVGRTPRVAVRNAFKKALSAILDGNITTLIAAIVLYFFGTGTIISFAQTLALGIILSMVSALLVTRLLVNQFVALAPDKASLYCLPQKEKKEAAKA